ncbi:MerR family transcriptional regulator [Arthrobacter sp. NPDC057013]|uniref:MerR family transcriptional regulator n=1 Tax=Arthrobacter sp. NPDC057013 TaxID=3345999 RepID=UPI003634DC1B
MSKIWTQNDMASRDAAGLLTPERTDGGTRQYSDADHTVLRRIAGLQAEGLNLA